MNSQEFLARSRNAKDVYFDPVASHAATHFADTEHLKQLVIQIIQAEILDEPVLLFHRDMGRIVGMSDLVVNDPSDTIMYAKRKNRDTYTSFNMSKAAQPSSLVSVGFVLQQDGNYELTSAWVGDADAPAFPGDQKATESSKEYWTSHSLAWGNQAIVADSLTDQCPW
jgi:hypothetical protein